MYSSSMATRWPFIEEWAQRCSWLAEVLKHFHWFRQKFLRFSKKFLVSKTDVILGSQSNWNLEFTVFIIDIGNYAMVLNNWLSIFFFWKESAPPPPTKEYYMLYYYKLCGPYENIRNYLQFGRSHFSEDSKKSSNVT